MGFPVQGKILRGIQVGRRQNAGRGDLGAGYAHVQLEPGLESTQFEVPAPTCPHELEGDCLLPDLASMTLLIFLSQMLHIAEKTQASYLYWRKYAAI